MPSLVDAKVGIALADLSEALKWLAENLEEVALDQEAEGFDPNADGTPLVTISKESVDAIENDLFKKILAGVGVVPPNDEQVSIITTSLKNILRAISVLSTYSFYFLFLCLCFFTARLLYLILVIVVKQNKINSRKIRVSLIRAVNSC